jgi:hypothetical protein
LERYVFARNRMYSNVTHPTNDSGTLGFLEELKVCMNVDVSE